MNKQNLYGMTDTALAGCHISLPSYVSMQEGGVNPISAQLQLQQPLEELVELKQVLASSQQQLEVAQQQIETLEQTNERFRQKLIRLAKKCMQARHLAYHDKLTGLPNRSLLLDRLKQEMVQSARQHKQVALLFIDLDKFKSVNDRFGHLAGDKLLQQVADRLAACVRYSDTVCRYGGDEFVVMLTDVDAKESAAAMKKKIRARLSASYLLDSHVIEITASIGVAIYNAGRQNCNELIKQADIAMYLAKVA
ncbi:diguanylate cyclase domain-containing protein [Methyloglobulus sp.]|uniref:diguanylate cyclase domain-containing protein n=1 Tax=Methyloglobulus sp. TaxID=2518622 RepID=UPI003988D385